MKLVRSARECGRVVIHPVEYADHKDSKLVKFIRKVWPRADPVIGAIVHKTSGAVTLSSGNLYEMLDGE